MVPLVDPTNTLLLPTAGDELTATPTVAFHASVPVVAKKEYNRPSFAPT
jgi:hypothetical protein